MAPALSPAAEDGDAGAGGQSSEDSRDRSGELSDILGEMGVLVVNTEGFKAETLGDRGPHRGDVVGLMERGIYIGNEPK